MPSKYEINIAHHGHHWGRVDLGQSSKEIALARLHALRIRFLEEDGFSLRLTYWSAVGHTIED